MHYVDAKGMLSSENGMNLFRGCSHGCIYCDSRSLCYGFTHPFEDIEIKRNAPELLEKALKRKRKKCMIGTGAMCDPYMPFEETLDITRRCLEIIDRYGFGLAIQTKSDRVLKDIDVLERINEKAKCVVQMTLTTHDDALCKLVEPGVCPTSERVKALNALRERGIPTVVWLSPILPFINDTKENIDGILKDCASAGVYGVICFGMGVTLRSGNREYFYHSLDRDFPGLKQKYVRAFGNAYECLSPNNDELMGRFRDFCTVNGIVCDMNECFRYLHEFPDRYEQMRMFI